MEKNIYVFNYMSSYNRRGFAPGGSYKANANGYGGGSKKSGLATNGIGVLGLNERFMKINAYVSPRQRQMVFCGTNMLGGIGAARSQFSSGLSAAKPDGGSLCKAHLFRWK